MEIDKFDEFETHEKPKETNYKKWAFKCFIYIVLLNVLVAYMIVKGNYEPLAILVCSILATLVLFLGTALTILTVTKKEEKNYQYYVSVIGYPIFIILTVLANLYI